MLMLKFNQGTKTCRVEWRAEEKRKDEQISYRLYK